MSRGYRIFKAVTLALATGFVSQAQAGVNLKFVRPANVDIRNVIITHVASGETCTLQEPWQGTACLPSFGPFFGSGQILFRIEWCPGQAVPCAAELTPTQTIDVWVDSRGGVGEKTIDIPAHNVSYVHNVGVNPIAIRAWSSRTVGAAQRHSGFNKFGNIGSAIASNYSSWNSPLTVPMLDGCYTIGATWGTCPGNGCNFDTVDVPVCVGGDAAATLTITLDNNVP